MAEKVLTPKIEALTAYANTITGKNDTTLSDAVASLADGYGGGGGVSVTRGMVFTAFDANDNPTAVDIYGDVPPYAIGYYSNGNGFGKYITSVTFHGNPTKIGAGAFQGTAITTLDIPDSIDSIGSQILRSNTAIAHYKHENARDLYGYGKPGVAALNYAPAANLVDIQLGAVGKAVTALYRQAFNNMTNVPTSTFTLYVYTTGDNVDSFLTTIRGILTHPTVVFKASEATTYNGTSYSAGDTILTSTPT